MMTTDNPTSPAMQLPRDRDILRRLYETVSVQLKQWDEGQAEFHAAFNRLAEYSIDESTPIADRMAIMRETLPQSSQWVSVSSELEPFLRNTAPRIASVLRMQTDDHWVDAYADAPLNPIQRRNEVDDLFKRLIAAGKELQAKILEAMTRWSKRRSPDEWEWVFKEIGEECSWKTIGRMNLRRGPQSTTKLVSFDIDQLPPAYDDKMARPKTRAKSP